MRAPHYLKIIPMKRSLCAALACAFIFISAAVPTQKASAYAVYGRVIEYDVGFYKDPQCTSLLFYLPYSYYVEIAEKGETISRAELFSGSYETPAIDGYVYTSELYFDDETPEKPFCEIALRTAVSCGFYADCKAQNLIRHIFENRTLKYYGYSYDEEGNYVYFADYNGELGYVKEESLVPFTFTPHPNPLPQPEEPETPADEPKDEGGLSTGLKVAIVVAIVLAAAVIIAFSVRPARKRYYFEEGEDDLHENEFR